MEFVYSKYYIVDTFGNYYRINDQGKLVAAHSKDEATVFSYEELETKLGKKRNSRFYKSLPADDAVLKGYLVSGQVVTNIVSDADTEAHLTDNKQDSLNTTSSGVNQNNSVQCKAEDICFGEIGSLENVDWKSLLLNFANITAKLPAYKGQLIQQEAETDQLICDIMHFIELYEYDDQDALEMMERLREARERRRIIKNELFRIEEFRNSIGIPGNADKAMTAYNKIKNKENGTYRPRVAPELFEKNEIRPRRLHKCVADMEEMIRKTGEEKQLADYIEREDAIMDIRYERTATIYDKEKMNWLAFVQLQVEFFQNAEQHIHNLKCDLQNVDEAIEEALIVIEGAHYNVTQGYRAFKELQELRNARSEILKELQQVQLITERFDCASMREAYEEIETELVKESEVETENVGDMDMQAAS